MDPELPLSTPTSGLQEAIDAAPPEGGVVQVPPGEYLLRQSVRLRSRVTLQGAGPSTRLVLAGETATEPTAPGHQGDTCIRVVDTSGFLSGMQISIARRLWYGWDGDDLHQPLVTAIDGDTLHLDTPLPHDCDQGAGTAVANLFPGILVRDQEEVTVRDLVLDGHCENLDAARQSVDFAHSGRVPELLGPFCSFTCAAIYAVGCRALRLERVTARRWPSDGFSIQRAAGAFVSQCEASHCRGAGIHPGMSSRHVVVSGSLAHHNAWDGLYLCHNVAYSTFTGNVLHHNGQFGIGGIGWDDDPTHSDQGNALTGNVCEANGWAGIQVIKGNRNVLSGNVCRASSQADPGVWPGILLEGARHMVVSGNLCYDDADEHGREPTQSWGVLERDSWDGKVASDHNLITGNSCHGNVRGAAQTVGPSTVKRDNPG